MVGKNPKTEFYFMTYDIWQHSMKYFQFLIQLCLFVYIHSMVALVLQQQSWVVATETYDLKPKYIYHLTHCRKCLPTIGLRQCFPNFNLHMNYLGILLKYRFWISRSEVGPESAFLTNFQVMLQLLGLGSHFDLQEPMYVKRERGGCIVKERVSGF